MIREASECCRAFVEVPCLVAILTARCFDGKTWDPRFDDAEPIRIRLADLEARNLKPPMQVPRKVFTIY